MNNLNFIFLSIDKQLGDVVIALDVAKRENTLNYEICNKLVKSKH